MPDNVLYASIGTLNKSRVDDGVLTFEASKATGPDLDADGQRVNMEWARKAMGDWFETGGNIREQHDSHRAVGKAMSLEDREDGIYTSGKIVDPISIRKVEEGVLTDLSIGIRGGRVRNGEIIGGKIVEVSLCDRGSNPTTKLVLAKAEGAEGTFEAVEELIEETVGIDTFLDVYGNLVEIPTLSKAVLSAADRQALPASDFAIPSKRPGPGSYPINDEAHARDALARSAGKPEEGTVRAAVKRKYPDMDVDSDKAVEPDPVESDPEDSAKAAKPTKANPDPDKDGDDDTTPSGDTDHDFWNEDGTPTAKGKAAGMKAKSVEPDAEKTEAPDLAKALHADFIKTLTTDPDTVAELRKALGIDEAESKWREKAESLEAQLEKALDAPILNAPSRTRPAGAASVTAAKAELTAKRDRYLHLAEEIRDPALREGYAEMAKAAEADLQKIA
jgi:hypothetical protein